MDELMRNMKKMFHNRTLDQMPAPDRVELPEEYDRFEVLIRRERINATREVWNCSDLFINGERFVDIMNRNMLENGHSRRSGGRYIGLQPRHVLSPCIDFIDMEHGFKHHDERRVQTLACKDCGIAECSTVPVLITVNDKKVTWSEIGRYPDTMGSFTFLRTQYEHALDHGNAAYFSAYHHANGIHVKRNRTMMLELFAEAIQQGNQQAINWCNQCRA